MKQENSALMQEIVQSAVGQKMLEWVSPVYGNARIALWLFQVIGAQMDDLEQWITSIGEQAYPQLVSWSMDIWEKQYGIMTDRQKSLAERRNILIAKVRERAPMTPYKLAQIVGAASNGIGVRVQENLSANKFGIYLNTIPSDIEESAVRKIVDRCKPAHLIYEIGYEQSTVSQNYLGIVMMAAKKLQIRQVN